MRVWEIEGTRVFCFSGMPFNCPIVGDEQCVRVCCLWIRRTYFSGMPFNCPIVGDEQCVRVCCLWIRRTYFSSMPFHCTVVVNGGDGHAIQLELRSVSDMAIERRAG